MRQNHTGTAVQNSSGHLAFVVPQNALSIDATYERDPNADPHGCLIRPLTFGTPHLPTTISPVVEYRLMLTARRRTFRHN